MTHHGGKLKPGKHWSLMIDMANNPLLVNNKNFKNTFGLQGAYDKFGFQNIRQDAVSVLTYIIFNKAVDIGYFSVIIAPTHFHLISHKPTWKSLQFLFYSLQSTPALSLAKNVQIHQFLHFKMCIMNIEKL